MNTKILSTVHLSAKEQLAYWNEAICNTFTKLHCDMHRGTELVQRGFVASLESWSLENFSLAEVRSPSSVVKHSVTHANQVVDDRLLIHLQTKGTSVHSQNNTDVQLRPGEFAITFASRPYQLDFNSYHEMLVVNISMKKFSEHFNINRVNDCFKVVPSDPINRMISMGIFTLWKCRQEHFDARVQATIENNIISSVATLIEVTAPKPVLLDTSIKRYHLARIKSVIEDNYADPDLSAEKVALAVNISERYLRSLLNSIETSFSRLIIETRLAKAAQMLRSPVGAQDKIIVVAYECGFKCPSHFNRVFRQAFDTTPSEYRIRSAEQNAFPRLQ